jgi:NADH-quinone oxidoreductase subunit A
VGYHFATVFFFAVVSVIFVLAMVGVGAIVRPRFPTAKKAEIYECGEKPIGSAWFNYNPRFYIIALIFVIFEVEVALMLPVVRVFKKLVGSGLGAVAFAEVVAFLLILAVGLAWVWARGDLDWIKRVTPEQKK